MFEKLKNIKFSFKKKSKDEDVSQSSLDDDIFSASDEGGEDFFSEPSFGAEGGEDVSFNDTSEEEISTPDRFGESTKVFSQDDLLKSSKIVKGGSSRRTLLLFLLFIVFAGYAAYAYILPQYYPDLLAELMATITGEEVAVKQETPKRVAVKKPVSPKPAPTKTAPAKPVPVKPVPAKPSGEAPKAEAPVKPVPAKVEEKQEAVKKAPQPVAPQKVAPKAPEPREQAKPVPVKEVAKAEAPSKPVPVKKAEKEVKAQPVPEKKAVVSPRPAPAAVVVPSKKPRKDIKITKGKIPVSEKGYYLQAGVYIFKGNLKAPKKKIESLGYTPLVKQGRKVIKMNRLLVGEWGDFLIAEDLVKRLRRNGFSAELISKNERFSALIGSFYYRHMADKKKSLLKKKGFEGRIEKTPINMKVHHLLVGPYNTPEEADSVLSALMSKGLKAVIIQKR